MRDLALNSDVGCLLCIFFLENCFTRAELRAAYKIFTNQELTDYALNKAVKSVNSIKKIKSDLPNELVTQSKIFQVDKNILAKELQLSLTLSNKF
jgi:hypothetical protein